MNVTKLLLIILFLLLLGIVSRREAHVALPPVSGVQVPDPDAGDYVRPNGSSLNNQAH
jgi:hypothetical protein